MKPRLFVTSVSDLFRFIIITISISISMLFIIGILPGGVSHPDDTIGIVSLGKGKNQIYFGDYDFTVYGFDLNGATYFFFPSFLQNISLDYSNSDLILYSEDGEIYTHPVPNQDVTVLVGKTGLEAEEPVGYRMGFYFSDNLYTICINLDQIDVDEIERINYENASIKLISPSGELNSYTKHALIKGRGNTTWGYEKEPYDIRFSKKISVAGLSESDSWTLLANHLDSTKMRNRLAFDIANIMGIENVTESEWIDLYINGDYRGNYLVCHEPSKIEGGYLEESNSVIKEWNQKYTFELPSGTKMTLRYPKIPTNNDKNYITSVTRNVDNAIHYELPEAQYNMIDRYSFARRFLLDEITLNADYDFSSHFYYNLYGEKMLRAGPCWDYDKAFGYPRYGARDWTNSNLSMGGGRLDWDNRLMEDEQYYDYVRLTFSQYVVDINRIASRSIDEYYYKIMDSVQMDRIRWLNGWGLSMYANYYNDIRYLKFFLSNRLRYLASAYCIDTAVVPLNVNNDEMHELILHMEDGSEQKMNVPDGTLLDTSDLPTLSGDDSWCFDFSGRAESITGFIPIYEDVNLIVAPSNYE